jgi:uncharacterized protein YbjT (DUF2867 family)
MTQTTAIVAGGTGLVGGFVLRQLEMSPAHNRVISLVRQAPTFDAHRIESMVGGLGRLQEISIDADAVLFCTLGTTIAKAGSQEAFRQVDYELPLKFAKWGKERDASCFVLVSSVGADSTSSNFYLRTKGELERSLEALNYPVLHIFLPSMLVGPRKENRTAEKIGTVMAQMFQFALVGGLRKYRPMSAERLALAMLRAATSNKRGVFRYSYDEIVELAA